MNDIIYVGKHSVTYSVDKHIHTSWEFIYCTSGEGAIVYSSGEIQYRPHSVMVIPPNIPHINRSSSGFTNIHINFMDVSLGFTEPTLIQLAPDNYLQYAFDSAFYYYSNGGLGRTMMLPDIGQVIITAIKMHLADNVRSEVVQEITDNIVRNYPDPEFDINAYLQTFSFSTEYLKKLFKKEMGMTPRQYLTGRRLENAANSLAVMGSAKNIALIARQSGFNDPLYFSKLFKQRYGVSPKFYDPSKSVPPGSDIDNTRIVISDGQEQTTSKQP